MSSHTANGTSKCLSVILLHWYTACTSMQVGDLLRELSVDHFASSPPFSLRLRNASSLLCCSKLFSTVLCAAVVTLLLLCFFCCGFHQHFSIEAKLHWGGMSLFLGEENSSHQNHHLVAPRFGVLCSKIVGGFRLCLLLPFHCLCSNG